jgi:hypothetical protein
MEGRCEILSIERDRWTKCWWDLKVRHAGKEWIVLFTVTRDMEFIRVEVTNRERVKNFQLPHRFYIPIDKRTLKRLYPGNESEVPRFFYRIVLPFLIQNFGEF